MSHTSNAPYCRVVYLGDGCARCRSPSGARTIDALRSRRVLFTAQSLGILQELKLHDLFEERLVVVFLGSKTEFKQQLNEYRLWGKQAAQRSQFRV